LLNQKLTLTSANSINIARFLPQSFYYFNAYARLKQAGALNKGGVVFSVPSGNFGNLTAGLFALEMGLPVSRFISANNQNDVVYEYLKSGVYSPRPSVETIANAMDVGTPSNFSRILDLYNNSYEQISAIIKGYRFNDNEIRNKIFTVYNETGYLTDPHGACGIAALEEYLKPGQTGVFLETAHPAKFTAVMETIVGKGNVPMPPKLASFMQGQRKSTALEAEYDTFRQWLLRNA
jgi:threonine synthase